MPLASTAFLDLSLDALVALDTAWRRRTGHGVGSYLSVHEGPQVISYYRGMGVPLKKGMVFSNEPGYYKRGGYRLIGEYGPCREG